MTKPILSSSGEENLPPLLPDIFQDWFASHNWKPRLHQLELLTKTQTGNSTLLIAPTGAGKTLAGFLPSLVALSAQRKPKPGEMRKGIHTLYISPLKALAVDIKRNLEVPIAEMGLDIQIETRTGDTPVSRRQRQKLNPPQILLTTPEQLALLIANKDAERFFDNLDTVILDELHSLVTSKRGHLLALGIARLRSLRPKLKTIGLSATVAEPDELRRWLVAQFNDADKKSDFIEVTGGARPNITILSTKERLPWAGHSARYAMGEVYEAICRHQTTLLFVNTRSQAELLFQELWHINDDNLPIALHHGSLDVGRRRRVEEAMQKGQLRAIVATSTLDLGIDWGDVDLVVHVGAPKGASRLAQRIGRSNHRMDEPSRAILVPANRFEVLECQAALNANYLGAQDTPALQNGTLDVLAQHILGTACAGPFNGDRLYHEITSAAPYSRLKRQEFDRVVDFVATGGYSLRAYEQYARIRQNRDGLWQLTHPSIAQRYRLNCGTIVEAPMLDVRLTRKKGNRSVAFMGGPVLGKIEEGFVESLSSGDTFLFAGQILRLEAIREASCYVSRASDRDAKIPSYLGGKFPLSTYLAEHIRGMLDSPEARRDLPEQVREWLEIQNLKSILPKRDELLIETFPKADRHYMVAYPFEGRLAHQTLGMLLTRRLERWQVQPLGFVATDYAIAVWGLKDFSKLLANGELSLQGLFAQDMLGDDLEEWLDESFLLKRTFRNCATISGLIERRFPGKEKTGRQMTVSSDLIYDVLRSHEPDHVLLQATREDASQGLLDIQRLGKMLARITSKIIHKPLAQISPLAVPIMMEIGKESIAGEAHEALLEEAAAEMARPFYGSLEP